MEVEMIDYKKYENDETFNEILDFLRENCLASENEVADATDIDWKDIDQFYRLAQAIVAEELEQGEIIDEEGYEIATGFMDYLAK